MSRKQTILFDAETHHHRFITTVCAVDHAQARRKVWKRISKAHLKLVAYFRENNFILLQRPGGCWGAADFGG